MFPTDELAQMRTDLETILPDAGTIYSLSRTSDGMGGWEDSWGTVGTCACRIDFIESSIVTTEKVVAGALIPYTRAIITMPQSTTITEQNRFIHVSGTYNVQAVNVGSWLGVKRATVEKV